MRLNIQTISLIFGLFAMASAGAAKSAEPTTTALPKIGDRHYVLNGQDRFAPVTIQKAESLSASKYLKDPVQPGQGVKVPVAKLVVRHAKARAQPELRVAKPAQLRFRKLTVAGHSSQPRVEFSRDLLTVDRADEPLTQDFYQKVFLPARDDNF